MDDELSSTEVAVEVSTEEVARGPLLIGGDASFIDGNLSGYAVAHAISALPPCVLQSNA